MDMMEKLSFFQGLVSCTYKVHIWSYNNQMEFISSTSSNMSSSDISSGDAILILNFSKKILYKQIYIV